MQLNLLRKIRVISNSQRDPQEIAGSDLRLRRIQIGQVLNTMPGVVKSPRSTEFKDKFMCWRLVTARLGVSNRTRCDSLENVATNSSSHQRLAKDQAHRSFRKFLQLRTGKIGFLRFIKVPCLCRYP